ncbi:MAG: hypothetical protein IT537_09945 [Hyphomicrobiales bacterium]|nr:hypothetical protein [Hyphomicrobiales bacterium]
MLDFMTLLYTSLLGLGLIGAQAALSDKQLNETSNQPIARRRVGQATR